MRKTKDFEKSRVDLMRIHAETQLFAALCNRNMGFIHSDEILSLPFLTITTQQELTTISISEDDTECWISLPEPFELQDDMEMLRLIHRRP